MKHPRFIYLFGASTVVAGILMVQAADTPREARARAELRRHMAQFDGQASSSDFPTVPPPSSRSAEPAASATSVSTSGSAPAGSFPAVPPSSRVSVASRSGSAALGGFPAVPPPSRSVPVNAEFPKVPPPSPMLAIDTSFPSVPPPSPTIALGEPSSADMGMASQSEQQRYEALQAAIKAGNGPASAYATPARAPLPPAFAGKEGELGELLVLYKAGTISAEEYHKKRAALVAQK